MRRVSWYQAAAARSHGRHPDEAERRDAVRQEHGTRQYVTRRQQEHLQAFLRLTHGARKLSIPAFAESVALSDSTMRRLLNYSNRPADPMTLFLAKRLAQGLGVSLDTLLGPPEPRPVPAPVPANAPAPADAAADILAALKTITEILSDLLQVQYNSLQLLQGSHSYERPSA
jgi:hypothetical protein